MKRYPLLVINLALMICSGFAGVRLVSAYGKLRNHVIVGGLSDECDALTVADQADDLASLCRDIVATQKKLPLDLHSRSQVIAEAARKRNWKWPKNYLIAASGEIKDCLGEPLSIDVLPDRVAVTADSLDVYYFAKFQPTSGPSN